MQRSCHSPLSATCIEAIDSRRERDRSFYVAASSCRRHERRQYVADVGRQPIMEGDDTHPEIANFSEIGPDGTEIVGCWLTVKLWDARLLNTILPGVTSELARVFTIQDRFYRLVLSTCIVILNKGQLS